MSNKYITLSEEAAQLLCSLIRESHSVSEGINDAVVSDTTTFSSHKLQNLMDELSQDNDEISNVKDTINNIIDGITPVGDSNNLGGISAEEWQNKLDIAQTTSVSIVSKAGWYRIAQYKTRHPAHTQGGTGNSCDVVIKQAFNSNGTEVIWIKLNSYYLYQGFKALQTSGCATFTKIRYTIEESTNIAYIEVYYSVDSSNMCSFEVSHGKDTEYTWQAMYPVLTEETVEGVTVTTTYDIPGNVSPATVIVDGDNEMAITNTSITFGDRSKKTNATSYGTNIIDSINEHQAFFGINLWSDGGDTDHNMYCYQADSFYAELYTGQPNLGNANAKWDNVYAETSQITTSDRREKTDIVELDDETTKKLIMALKPSSYKFVTSTSDRTHYGLIAQDVEETMDALGMTSKDFAGFIKSPKMITSENNPIEKVVVEGEYIYGLRYEEFIAPLIKMIQVQQKQIDELISKVEALSN